MAIDRRQANLMKQAATVFGALAFGWLTVELAFRPILEKFRAAMDKSDHSIDPDDAADAELAAAVDKAIADANLAAAAAAADGDVEKSDDVTKPVVGDAAANAVVEANDQ